jgi:hypothetical protein
MSLSPAWKKAVSLHSHSMSDQRFTMRLLIMRRGLSPCTRHCNNEDSIPQPCMFSNSGHAGRRTLALTDPRAYTSGQRQEKDSMAYEKFA